MMMEDYMKESMKKTTEITENVIKSLLSMAGINSDDQNMERIQGEMELHEVKIDSHSKGNRTIYCLSLRGKPLVNGEVWYEYNEDMSKCTFKSKLSPIKEAPTDLV